MRVDLQEMVIRLKFQPFPFPFKRTLKFCPRYCYLCCYNNLFSYCNYNFKFQLCNGGGLMSGLTGNGHSTQIPTISVSVQTEPQMLSTFGLSNTAALLSNGGLQNQVFLCISCCFVFFSFVCLFLYLFVPFFVWFYLSFFVLFESLIVFFWNETYLSI